MFKSEARGRRGQMEHDRDWERSLLGELGEDALADAGGETLWEAEMWAIGQKQAKRARARRRQERARSGTG